MRTVKGTAKGSVQGTAVGTKGSVQGTAVGTKGTAKGTAVGTKGTAKGTIMGTTVKEWSHRKMCKNISTSATLVL